MFRNIFKEEYRIYHISKPIIRRHLQKTVIVRFEQLAKRRTFIQIRQGEPVRQTATFLAPFFVQSCDHYFLFSLSLCYERIGS